MAQTTTQNLAGRDAFLTEFARLEGDRTSDHHSAQSPWLASLRKAAMERFADQGFPTTRREAWRFTDLAPLAATHFRPARFNRALESTAGDLLGRFALEGAESVRLVFVNGHWSAELSSLGGAPQGIKIQNLRQALEENPTLIEPHLAGCVSYQDQPFVALNTAFMRDGAFVSIPRGLAVEAPLHLIFLTVGEEAPTVTHPRVLILAGESSQARIVETFAGVGEQPYFTNAVTEMLIGEDATLDHYKLQQESAGSYHLAAQMSRQLRASNLTSTSVSIGAGLARNEAAARLDGEGSDCQLNGLYLACGTQHIDNHTYLEHARPHCASRQLYKGILDEASSAVFNGRIKVLPDAQKTDAIQANRNLLLTERATINTQPQLEIFADDVRCTHGATIGQLDADSIFYLRSRGIDLATARALLTYAFANEVIDRIRVEPLRRRLEQFIASRFRPSEREELPS